MLTLKALRCVNLRNVAQSSSERQDPYVTLTLQENPKLHSKTDVCYSGGVNPQWFSGNWMRLPVPKPGMTCLVQVWDKHSQDADELIASGSIRLGQYDEDGAEEEPTSVELTWENGLPAGQFHCVFSYDPPVGNLTARQIQPVPQVLDTSSYDHLQAANPLGGRPEQFVPWLKLQVTHKSGKVKDFVISKGRTGIQQGYTRGRSFVDSRVPQARGVAFNQYDRFRQRSMIQQAIIIAALILLVAMPWPRSMAYSMFSSMHEAANMVASKLYDWTSQAFGTLNEAASTAFSYLAMAARYVMHTMWNFSWYIGMYFVLPVTLLLCTPRLLGWGMTKIGTMILGGNIVSFGTVTFVPWITDFRRLKFRLILVDFLLGNPRDKAFTPRFVSFNRFEFVGSVAFADFWNFVTLSPKPCPLRDTPDFRKLTSLRVDHMELDGLAINLEVNERNKLNVLDFVSEYDRAQVNRALALKELTSSSFRFPNCLEVQVLGARNLRSMDANGLSDPYYTVQLRKQHISSDTVVKTLNPNFPSRVEQFFLDDPSAVVSVVLRDQDVLRNSDFLGQWNLTTKWLLIDPKKAKYVEWETLGEEERRQGWIGFWAPLVDEKFRSEGTCGDVHIRMRWVYNPALPDARPGERRESLTPLQQLNQLRHEIRQRLGDLERIFDVLKHIPILLDYQGVFILNDTKLSIHDVLFGRRREADNVVKKLMVKHRERTEKRQHSLVSNFPRSLDVKETSTAVDHAKIQPAETATTGVESTEAIQAVDTPLRGALYPERGVPVETMTTRATTTTLPSTKEEAAMLSAVPITAATKTTTTTTTTVMPSAPTTGLPTLTPKNDGIDEVTITSADPNNPVLPRDLNLEINTKTGTGVATTGMSSVPVTSTATMTPPASGSSTKVAPYNFTSNVKDNTSLPSKTKSASTDFRDKDVMTPEEREKFERDREREHQRQLETGSGTTTVNTAGVNTPWFQTQPQAPLSKAEVDLKETIAKELGSGDKLNAVYPEKLVSSAPFGDKGYIRGELAIAREELGNEQDVYLGAEEDDESAEQRNEDRFNDDDREYDQDGREFIKIRPIVWRRQFLARHGDPGLNVYKFLERMIRGLIPKLAADTRLQKALAGTTIKSILKGELAPGETSKNASAKSSTVPPDPTARESGVKGAAQRVVGGIKEAAHAVKDQAKLVEKKIAHHSQDAALNTDPAHPVTSVEGSRNMPYVREGDEPEVSTPKAGTATTTRPVHGQDSDFSKSDLVIAGGLEAVWQGRHRITSLFRRWKPWHVEIKGDTIFYHQASSVSALSSSSAADAVWYSLDLTWIQDIFLTDSHREANNELVLRFVQDDNTLHFRLPSKSTTPTLQEWLTAFRRVQHVQQERNRLGSVGYGTNSPRATSVATTQSWPGEDMPAQPRSRGSSLAVPPTKDVNLVKTPSKQEFASSTTTAPSAMSSTTSGTSGLVRQQPDTSYGQPQPVMSSSMDSKTMANVPPPKPQSELINMSAPKPDLNVVVPPNQSVNLLVPPAQDTKVIDMTKNRETLNAQTDPNLTRDVAQS